MNPDYLFGASGLGMALLAGDMLSAISEEQKLSPEERRLKREQQEKLLAIDIAAKRAASPHVAAAERKRERKADKLRKIK